MLSERNITCMTRTSIQAGAQYSIWVCYTGYKLILSIYMRTQYASIYWYMCAPLIHIFVWWKIYVYLFITFWV